MKTVSIEPDFEAWRIAARDALRDGFLPSEIDFEDVTVPRTLALTLAEPEHATGPALGRPRVPKAFLETATLAAVHRDPQRWNLLYRLLFRLQGEANLLQIETDEDVAQLLRLASQVRRDLHKMHAFVRFRKVLEAGDPSARPVVVDEVVPISLEPHAEPAGHHLVLETPTPFGPVKQEMELCRQPDRAAVAAPYVTTEDETCDHFIAWYQPDHRIVPLAAPFFAERFAIMRWTVLTPDASVSWDPVGRQLSFGDGVPRDSAPAEDELEALWRSYYSSIYNPARLNTNAMRSEMPVRYWKNLPEVAVLPQLITQSKTRVETMVARQQNQPTAQPFVPQDHTPQALAAALPACKGCDLYCHAIQVVPGRGRTGARLMLVGEQPGDQEDKQGEPFVGPAGAVLDRMLSQLGIPRDELYVTNAVKHFKFVQRGKLRLHQNPRMSEVMACRPWLLAEIEGVRPQVILCLGASASKSLLGGTFALMRDHGKLQSTPFAERVYATVHPSAVLRARDEQSKRQLETFLADDLARAWQAATGPAPG